MLEEEEEEKQWGECVTIFVRNDVVNDVVNDVINDVVNSVIVVVAWLMYDFLRTREKKTSKAQVHFCPSESISRKEKNSRGKKKVENESIFQFVEKTFRVRRKKKRRKRRRCSGGKERDRSRILRTRR